MNGFISTNFLITQSYMAVCKLRSKEVLHEVIRACKI